MRIDWQHEHRGLACQIFNAATGEEITDMEIVWADDVTGEYARTLYGADGHPLLNEARDNVATEVIRAPLRFVLPADWQVRRDHI